MVEDKSGDSWVPGGPSLYVSRCALALGASVSLLTHLSRRYNRSVLQGIELLEIETETVPRYENSYSSDGSRAQLLYPSQSTFSLGDISNAVAASAAEALFVAPAYHEVPALPTGIHGALHISLQGYFRATEGHRVIAGVDAWDRIEAVIRPGAYAYWSVEDAGSPAEAHRIASRLASRGVRTLVTDGSRGAWFPSDEPGCAFRWRDAIPPQTVVDPTGAGDAFATAFAVRLTETADEDEAARFALAAGSLAVERTGIMNVPGRAAIETRAKQAGEG